MNCKLIRWLKNIITFIKYWVVQTISVQTFYIILNIIAGLGSSASAACKTSENQPSTILKISWKSKIDPNMTIPLLKNFSSIQKGLNLWVSFGCRALYIYLLNLYPFIQWGQKTKSSDLFLETVSCPCLAKRQN